jgi:hypothetical protein
MKIIAIAALLAVIAGLLAWPLHVAAVHTPSPHSRRGKPKK